MLNFCKVYFDYLKFEGSDRLDLINRLSTNEVNSLEKYKGTKTILTSDKGRIIDVITMFNFGDFVFASCSAGNSDKVLAHLEKYTIMDDFRATNMAGTHETLLFIGDETGAYSKELFGTDATSFTNNDFLVLSEENNDAIASHNDDALGGFYFIYANEEKQHWERKLFSPALAGKYDLKELTAGEQEVKRIELGIPGFGKELSELTNPLECGLWDYVSFTKGCYIGQEVIARLDTYDKISKHLVGIKADEAIPVSDTPGETKILLSDNQCGFVTSSAVSEKFGNIGLGFVKTILLDNEKDYKIRTADKLIYCRIVKLPFGQNIE